ncbi:MAG TPA: amidase [Deltaproteobacteria bacterium]|nr:amidase [Deltaproteobacteria bacterium]
MIRMMWSKGVVVSIACACLLFGFLFCAGKAVALDESPGVNPEESRIVFLPAHRLADMIRTGRISSTEAVEAYLEQIERHNPGLNAIVTLDAEGARKRAREADEALKRGEIWGPLHGVPVTFKDNYATAGLRTTNSHPPLAEYVPDFDATVVERIRKAGAVILGKTNLPQIAMDYQTRSPVFGVANNPWDVNRTPGGSTGGGAAAVAAGMTALCMGNDIGGSIRIPSHFCGIYGIKPTENLVSKHGISPGMPRMDSVGYRSVRHLACSGPLARSIEDLILSLRIIAGPDLKDQDVPVVCLDDPPPREMKDLRIAWTDDFGGITVTEETSRAIQEFAGRLARAGCTVERAQPENFDPEMVWGTYGRIMDMELGPYNPPLMRFVNFLFGWSYRKDVPMIRMVYPITFDKYMTDLTRRDALTASLEEFLQEWDVWVTPVSTTPAYPHIEPKTYFGPYPVYTQGVSVDGTEINYLVANSAYTTVFNLTGSPVVVTPIAYTEDGMPIGVQIAGKRWRDMELLTIAGMLDKAAGAYRTPPGY